MGGSTAAMTIETPNRGPASEMVELTIRFVNVPSMLTKRSRVYDIQK